ncbi:porin [Ramlibacter sp.]|uniref:porin n=1 Tax=Ramlibacter sp. TaxID=1917967 RepID=UPI003D0F5CE7
MKRSMLAAALAILAGGAANAQSSVTMFGLVDVGYAHLSGRNNGSLSILGPDGYQSSRLGFRGVEDLGGGLRASFWLEAALTPDDGQGGATNSNNQPSGAGAATAGRQGLTFNRRSTVSIAGSWGEVRLGRDYVPGFWNLSAFNPFGTNGVGSSGHLFYPVQGAARVTNVRASNSFGYILPGNLNGFYGQAMYALGENASNAGATEDDGDVLGFRLGWASGKFDAAFGVTRTEIAALGDLRQTNFGASYDFGMAKPMVLINENRTGATRTRTWLIGATVPAFGIGMFRAAYSRVNTSAVANDADQWALGYVHNLSKRTAVYANWSRVSNKAGGTNYHNGRATTAPGGSSTGYELGLRHTF